jgi:hypothetical protein
VQVCYFGHRQSGESVMANKNLDLESAYTRRGQEFQTPSVLKRWVEDSPTGLTHRSLRVNFTALAVENFKQKHHLSVRVPSV